MTAKLAPRRFLMRVTVLPYHSHSMSSGLNARPAPAAGQIARLHCHLVFPLWPSCRCFSLSIYPQLIHQTGCMALTPGITSAHRLVNIYRPKLVFRPALQLFREKSTSQLDSTGWRISREPQDRMVLENVYTGRRNEEDGTHRICGISISTFPRSAINGFFQGNEDK